LSAVFGIKSDALGKQYRITPVNDRGRRLWPGVLNRRPIWALRDVSFEVPQGSTLGIIGRNGAGKTTLLKVLSRVTPPTSGRALIRGRASSLLEVGTGFHPELTGRENVFLNGAVLGMRRNEIARKFDEIVAFSEIEEFIDTPVKRYSTGMALRLAFAVAAHLEPDVLLVDEVLAVGDASFQAKSLGKMSEVTGEGRTVVLVSHNMPTILSFADRCLWLDGGQIAAEGRTDEVVERYIRSARDFGAGGASELAERERGSEHPGAGDLTFERAELRDEAGEVRHIFFEGEPITLDVTVRARRATGWLEVRAYAHTLEGIWLFAANSGKRNVELDEGLYRLSTTFAPNHLRPGQYRIDLAMQSGLPQDFVGDAIRFEITHSLGGEDDPTFRGAMGLMRFDYPWTEPRREP
jgi:lipopolysaccharide transport system ATP-binding protein